MLRPRLIPCLLIQENGLVKTVNFSSPKYVGDPINAVRIFNEKGVDELIILDIGATKNSDEPNYEMIARLAAECRMPFCYGGGIKTLDQVKRIIGLGVEKVALGSIAIDHPELITKISNEIGCQSVVVILDVKKRVHHDGYDVYKDNGKFNTRKNVFDLVLEIQKFGAGEIVINSIDKDGTMMGYDLELAAQIRRLTRVPITFLGGAGSLLDIELLIKKCGVVGAAAGSFFIYKGSYKAVLLSYPSINQRAELINRSLTRDIKSIM